MQIGKKELEKEIQAMRESGEEIYSFSKLETANDCPYAYKLAYIDKREDLSQDNIYSVMGSVIHDALEKTYNGEEVDIKKEFDEGYYKCKNDGYDFPDSNIKEGYMKCMHHYIENFKKDEFNSIQEYVFLTDIDGIKVTGFIDRITKDPDSEEKTLRIIDYKTSTAYAKKDLAKKGRQLILYAYALEKEKGVKVTKVCWNMLKYVNVYYSGKTRKKKTLYRRDEYVMAWKDEIIKELESLGYDIVEALDIFMENAVINVIPEQVADKFKITEGYLEYEYNEETKQDLIDYVKDSVKKIKELKEFKPKNIDYFNKFSCQTLCNFRDHCPALKKHNDALNEIYEESDDIDFEDIF